ncbi:hypothetical protein JCM21900_000271 [Sporobolomyces salmonicolor]
MTGIFTCPGLPPLILTFFSSRQGTLVAATSMWRTWFSFAHRFYGETTVATVGNLDRCLYACVRGIAVSAFVTGIVTLFRPAHYDLESLSAVRIVADAGEQSSLAGSPSAAIGVLPLMESRHGIVDLARSVFGKGSQATRPRASTPPTPRSPDGPLDEDAYLKALDDQQKIRA